MHGWVCSGIIGAGDRTVLGAAFMRAFYTVFDRGEKLIGLAPSANCTTTVTTTVSSAVGADTLMAALTAPMLAVVDAEVAAAPPSSLLWLFILCTGVAMLCTSTFSGEEIVIPNPVIYP